jgi:hypothetical protein
MKVLWDFIKEKEYDVNTLDRNALDHEKEINIT